MSYADDSMRDGRRGGKEGQDVDEGMGTSGEMRRAPARRGRERHTFGRKARDRAGKAVGNAIADVIRMLLPK